MNCNILYFVFLSIIGCAFGQISNNLDLDTSKLSKDMETNLKDLGKTFQENGVNLPELNVTSVNVEKVEQVLREKCEKQGAGDVVDSIKDKQEEIKNCVTENVNVTQVQEELEEAKKTGSMDVVFAKYCKKWPEIYECVENVTSEVRRCLSETEEKTFNRTLTIVSELQEFMCYKDGDRLAMFVAEGGVECIEQQKDGIQDCLNSTLKDRLPSDVDELSVASLPVLAFNQETCQDFATIRDCVTNVLEKCENTTPANIVDAFFKFLKKQMPCGEPAVQTVAASQQPKSSGVILSSSLVTFVVMILSRFY